VPADFIAAEVLLPDYEILDQIGSGSFGVVLRARQKSLDRFVAIKQLPAVLASDAEVLRRFVTEARVLSAIDHPHVVPVFDFVSHGGACVLIMELLTGGSLSDRRAGGALKVADLLAIGLAACSGLEAAHARGVLHRDIKPANLLFAESGALKIVDFGIAKMIGGGASLATVTGTVLGSASFMAPEQVLGDPVSPATDVYALATVLYESLAASLPFPGDRNDQLQLLMARVERDPIPLVEVADVPLEIAGVIMRALDPRPAARPPTAQAFGVELAGAADGALGPGWLRDTSTTVFASGALLEAIGPALTGNRIEADETQERWATSGLRRVALDDDAEEPAFDMAITGVRDLLPLHEVMDQAVAGYKASTASIEMAAIRDRSRATGGPWVGGFRARLRVREPGTGDREVDIAGPTLVGRDADGLPVSDLEVSRRHCVVAPTSTGVLVTDLRSSNGTFVADVLIDGRAVARPGDEIRVGASSIAVLAIEPIVRNQLVRALDAVVVGAMAMTGADCGWLVDVVPEGVRVLAGAAPEPDRPMIGSVVVDGALTAFVRSILVPVVASEGSTPLGTSGVQVPLCGRAPLSRLSVPCVADGRVVALLEVGAADARRFDAYLPFVAPLASVAAALLAPDDAS